MMLISNNNNSSPALYSNGLQGLYRRIRTPHEHDVLSGRGGGINAHLGNVQFREWVRLRKNAYNLAPTKVEKSRVAQEVIDLVRNQKPPGRFLQKDPTGGVTGGWWVEIDEERVMAKTSQALREGAPQIRAAHQTDPLKTQSGRKSIRKAALPLLDGATPTSTPGSHDSPSTLKNTSATTVQSSGVKRPFVNNSWVEQEALRQLKSNATAAQFQTSHLELCSSHQDGVNVVNDDEGSEATASKSPIKRVRVEYNGHTLRPTDETPPMNGSNEHPVYGIPPPLDLSTMPASVKSKDASPRDNSLSLPDIQPSEDWTNEAFVNPFEDETFLEANLSRWQSSLADGIPLVDSSESSYTDFDLKPGIFHRESSTSSDMGGLGALMKESKEDELEEKDEDRSFSKELHDKTKSSTSEKKGEVVKSSLRREALLLDPLLSLDAMHNESKSFAPSL
ncbi:hypothetical protein ACA910_021419 [Epithemia clementina (nom. ined.)]